MKRGLFVISIALLLGVLCNVVVAWRITLIVPGPRWDTTRRHEGEAAKASWTICIRRMIDDLPWSDESESERREQAARLPDGPVFGWNNRRFGFHHVRVATSHGARIAGESIFSVEHTFAGWPMHSLAGYARTTTRNVSHPAGWLDAANPTPLFLARNFHLPVRPLWTGFIVDSALYALAFAALWHLIGSLRRRWKTERSRCPSCAYDLRTLLDAKDVTCPECGTCHSSGIFARERLMLRPWMILALLPAFIAAGLWFLAIEDPDRWVPYGAPGFVIDKPWTVTFLCTLCGVVMVGTWVSLPDRPRKARLALAIAMGLAIGLVSGLTLFQIAGYIEAFG